MPTLAEKQKAFRGRTWPGKLCIFTVAGGRYQAFAPLFVKMAKKAYPDVDVKVLVPGEIKIDETDSIISVENIFSFEHPLVCAALRFVVSPEWIMDYDYVLITDVDMMIIKEEPGIVAQHMMDMEMNGLECYSNWLMEPGRMPGVHFATKDWWRLTERARKKELDFLLDPDTMLMISEAYDERMLYRIVNSSGLPPAPMIAKTWMDHGLHLGAYRNWNCVSGLQFSCQAAAIEISKTEMDKEISIASKEFPWIGRFVNYIKKEYHI